MTPEEILHRAAVLGYLPEEQMDRIADEIRRVEHDSYELRRTVDAVLESLPEPLHWDFLMCMMRD